MYLICSKQNASMILLVCFCLVSNGCGNQQKLPEGMPQPHPAIFTIIQDGQPLENALIALIPVDRSSTWNAGGITDSKGQASLKTLSQYQGVVPGKYTVLITKTAMDESKFTAPDPNSDPQGYAKYIQNIENEIRTSYSLVDPKFSQISADSEQIEVVSGMNEKTIDVGKAVRIKQ